MNLQMLKKAMLAYVSAVKFVWSSIAYPLSIVGKKFMSLRGYRVYGNSVQDGTPSPETPIEIESVGDLSTKNLFDKDKEKYNVFVDSDTVISKDNYYTIFIDVENISNFTISIKKEIQAYYGLCDSIEVGSEIYEHNYFNKRLTRTVTNNTRKYVGISIYYTNISAFDDIQIEEGTTATEYEPYHKYKIPVVVRGKNLFDGSSSEGEGKYLSSTGSVNSGSTNLRVTDYITIPSGASSLTFSYKGDNMYSPSMCLYDENKKYITGVFYSSRFNVSISVPSNAKYVRCSYRTVNTDIQLETGSTKTEYEPYIAPVITNIFLDEPLRKVGDYSDYIDFKRQKVVRKIKKRDFDGSEDWKAGTIKETTNVYMIPFGASVAGSRVCISNRFIDSAESDVEKIVIGAEYFIYVAINKTTAADLATFRTWLANNPTYVIYPLAIPTEETVKLPAIPQFKGTTIYEVGTNIKPSGMEVKYC